MLADVPAVTDRQEDLFQRRNRDTITCNAKFKSHRVKLVEEVFEQWTVLDRNLESDLTGYLTQFVHLVAQISL